MADIRDAVELLRNEKLNVQIEFVLNDDGDYVFNARGTYWRGTDMADYMYLAGGLDLEEAVVLLAQAVYDRAKVPVDWRARMHTVGVYERKRPVDIHPLPSRAFDSPHDRRNDRDR